MLPPIDCRLLFRGPGNVHKRNLVHALIKAPRSIVGPDALDMLGQPSLKLFARELEQRQNRLQAGQGKQTNTQTNTHARKETERVLYRSNGLTKALGI